MRKFIPITLLLLFSASFSFAQCGMGEVEVRVDIITDNWGYETSWTVSDLAGSVIMEGGQGGVYENNTSYSDSVCIGIDDCLIFEIYDGYGDGIYAPNGYSLYVDEVLVSSGADDIQDYAMFMTNCPSGSDILIDALNDLQGHINGTLSLSTPELSEIRGIFNYFSDRLAESEFIIELAQSVVADYDEEIGALFTTPATQNGFSRDPAVDPGLEVERAMLALQQGMFDFVFLQDVYDSYPEYIDGYQFNSCYSFPGYVDPPADPAVSNSLLIRANFEDPDGMNPYYDINGDGTAHAFRPTGIYLAPGSVVRVSVAAALVDQDYYVRVGAHEWDLSNKPIYKRMDRISKKFPIDSTTIEVFNPLGGAIGILIPYGAAEGIVEISVANGVEAPFFSLKSFYETPDFDAELSKPGPWAVFETDNVMYTIPSHSIIPGEYDLRQSLEDWDKALQAVNSIMARQIIPDKHNVYMIADVLIRFSAYSIGYPLSNTPLTYTDVPGPAYFIDGPGPNDETNFHEYGHALAMSKFPGEVEALVNFPYIMAMNYGLNEDLNEAVKYSFVPNTFNIDRTATHRMLSNSFGFERDIANSTTNEVRYQHRGYGHYFEIVNLFGWCPLRNFWKQEFIDFENGIDHGINDQDIDSRIIRMSVAAQADLRPLFHVFGILPQDPIAVQDSIDLFNIPSSLVLYDRLQAYFDLIPEDNAAFVDYALIIYPNLYTDGPSSNPDYGVGWHYQKSLTYDMAEALQRTATLQDIIDLYYPDGEPSGDEPAELCCLLDTMTINLIEDEVNITGGTAPYEVIIDTTGSVVTVTVIDFDACESAVQYTFTGLPEVVAEDFRVFPNPTNGEVQIDFGNLQDQVTISTMDLSGKLIQNKMVLSAGLVSCQLPEASGVYLLKITYADGGFSVVKVVKE